MPLPFPARPQRSARHEGEQGFALVALIVAIFVILLFLGIAAPKVARDLRRERELEAVHRGNQYVRAVQLYYKKFNSYPTSIDQLEKTNNIRFLRQKYVDPMTGKADWRIIHVGENKTTVKGLFGQPLTGLAGGAGLGGSGIGGTSTVSGTTGDSTSAFGSGTSASGSSSTFGSSSGSGSTLGGATSGSTSIGGTGSSTFGGPSTVADGSGTGNSSSGSSSGIGSQSATGFKGSGGPIMGFGSSQSGSSIITLNEQNDYAKWEFLYDPRIEQLKARSSLFGGGGIGSSNAIGGSGTGTSSFGSSPAGTFGASPGSTTGSGIGSGTGSGSTPTTPSSPTGTTPQ